MTRQEIFNKVATHLLKQGERSVSDDNTCLYRGPNGLKCAVGCLIPDDLYDPALEGGLGCWSSTSRRSRSKISKEYCKDCELFKAASS